MTAVPIARFTGRSYVDLLRWRAEQEGHARLFTELRDGEDDAVEIGYDALDRRARAIAVRARSVAGPGDRALLLFEGGIDFAAAFFGCLYAGVVAVPAYPPDPARLERTLPRLEAIVRDARPRVILTTE